MKRCPKCDFIYLDADVVCDLDGALLVHTMDELVVNEVTPSAPPATSQSKSHFLRWAFAATLAVLVISISIFVVYYGSIRRNGTIEPLPTSIQTPLESQTEAKLGATPVVGTSPQVSSSPIANSSTSTHTANISPISRGPVSTSNYRVNSGRAVIRLTNGADIQADEVWRTKDGVWYRRSGVVTLIRRNQVRSIESVK